MTPLTAQVSRLSLLRKCLRDEINATGLFSQPLFECWINEVEPSKAATRDVWDECMHEVRRAHIGHCTVQWRYRGFLPPIRWHRW
jgi:hypothetical protein